MSIRIDKEFKALIPPLTPEEYAQLEENIVRDGIRDPLVVWHVPNGDDILIDGHNRFEIAVRHSGILFELKRMEFDTREDVIKWIILNQFGRRNLSAYDRSILALKLKPVIAGRAKEKEAERKTTYQKSEKSPMPKMDTAKELATIAGVSHDTIHKVETIEAKATPETKQLVRDGKLSINQAYNSVQPKRPDPVKQAQEEHEQFTEKKQAGVVNMADIQMDKLNQKIINTALLQEVLELLNKVDAFGMKHKGKELETLHDMVEDKERKLIIDRCLSCKAIFMEIANYIT